MRTKKDLNFLNTLTSEQLQRYDRADLNAQRKLLSRWRRERKGKKK
jgi:hypothetical protein